MYYDPAISIKPPVRITEMLLEILIILYNSKYISSCQCLSLIPSLNPNKIK